MIHPGWRHAATAVYFATVLAPVAAQQNPALPEPKNWTAAEDHRQMMEQLGIKALRPGPSGNEQDPNHANYDEAKANPFPTLPEVLRFKNGAKVTSARQWPRRRAKIVEDFEREVYGRIPTNVPTVTWTSSEVNRHARSWALPACSKAVNSARTPWARPFMAMPDTRRERGSPGIGMRSPVKKPTQVPQQSWQRTR